MRKFTVLAALTAAVLLTAGPSLAADTAPATTQAKAQPAAPKPIVAVMKLSGTLLERPADFSFSLMSASDPSKSPNLAELIVTLNKAVADPALAGILLDLTNAELSLSQAQELGGLIKKVRTSGKRVIAYAADFDTPTYVLASYADKIAMPDQGNVMIPGVQLGLMFFKGLLDKVHVQADMVQIGDYKGAAEPMTNTEASPKFNQTIDQLADGMFDQITSTIAANRPGLDAQKVNAAIDEAWLTGKRAKALGLVDMLQNRREIEDRIQTELANAGGQPELITDYGQKKRKGLDMENPFAFFALLSQPDVKPRTNQPAIAVIYADGTITGDAPGGVDSENVTPSRIRKAVQKAVDDRLVKAIVLRVDSPGGSASASDEIWQILKQADKQKPVTVSMGRMAASGGYYIACAGRSISADPATITGSIGVVGGKIVIKGLLDTVGINVQPILRGKRAGMLSSQTAWSPEERLFVRDLMTETYDLFTSRVKEGRGAKIKDVAEVAQGRLFTGKAAKEVGLVDEVRTLPETIQASAHTAGIEKNYQIIVYPEQRTIADVLREGFSVDAKLPLELSAALEAVPASYRREAVQMLGLLKVMREERVMMACPLGLVEEH